VWKLQGNPGPECPARNYRFLRLQGSAAFYRSFHAAGSKSARPYAERHVQIGTSQVAPEATNTLSPDTVLKKIIRPALVRAGIAGKVIGWHSFRHSLATNLWTLGIDVKVAPALLRHANSRTTMDIYTHAVSTQKREASGRVLDMMLLPKEKGDDLQHPSAPLDFQLAVTHAINPLISYVYGGDDGARTRDLCRDRLQVL
jgi:hypothetical protein